MPSHHTHSSHKPIVLTIAGSDSGGGAGIQADIKAISATGGYACSVITALTAQNTRGVSAVHPVPQDMIRAQLEAVFSDLQVTAVKVGMLGDSATIRTVAEVLRRYRPAHLVVDPVMVTANGDMLLAEEAVNSLRQELLPLADVITPNLPEAAALIGSPLPATLAEVESLFEGLAGLDCAAVLLKGGFLQQESRSPDWLLRGGEVRCFDTPRVITANTHGTGCTLSAALACYLGQGLSMDLAVSSAKHYIDRAILAGSGLRIGQGRGPVEHFFDR
ncbi:bifunctional hydroxymethylpyrimidine kinase/phosphomethylpyrimidine kinase [Oceanisphaera arctica]|uniref:hydroxymethylpyrimidine kinase n=1 Tax=Oceanisphaera arctica TaxID=641510 RepID=A0A2P5TIA4_9GAMM|nr:bifunctional hydroxymethylpyrimidine kinase/phosphomethylpyrimidine kinase [Oceanisphaera arctica]PPL14420.1 bifunctional hydroxymethylpyrimidine kinase/phosphomethylpyrimidine kinase [Oceanisphaera arctica]GHA14325.1 hydroxymethylpyrimidine/phosphomethylpyrimidine kinase [Oceanisphaera arctica]